MNWEDLRHFLALAEHGSLSEAARRQGVDHTTIARRVAALERALGLKLVDRLPRATVLTAEGERIATAAGPVGDGVLAVLRAARGADPAMTGPVVVSAPPALASTVLAAGLAPLRERHPGIVVHLIGDTRAAALNRREADVAVRLDRPAAESGMVARRVGALPFGLYGAPRLLDGPPPEDWGFIAYDRPLDHVPQQRWLMAVAGDRPVVMRTNDLLSMVAAAVAGIGVAALPVHLGETTPGLRRIIADGQPPPVRELWLAVHDDIRNAPRIRAVMEHFARIIAEMPGGGDGMLAGTGLVEDGGGPK